MACPGRRSALGRSAVAMRFIPSRTSISGGLRLELVMIVGGLVASAHASMMIVIPVMPRFIELIGGSAFIFGLAFSMQAIGRFLTNIPAGVLSERIGRKWVIIIGGLGVALFATLSGLSDSIPMFLIFRFFSGVASAMTIVVANVVAADLSTVENRGRVLGLMHGLQLVVGTGSPALGGVIGEVFGTRTPFYVSGIAVLTFALWGILRLPETRPAPGPQSAAHARHSGLGSGAIFLLRDPSFLMVCILGFSTFFLRGGMSTTLIPIYADDILKMGPGQIGLLFTISSLMHSVLIYPAGAMADKYGRKIVILPAGILVGLTIIALPFSETIGLFVTSFLLLHIAQGWGGQAPIAYVADLAPQGMRGMAIGMYRTFGDAAGIIGPVISTSLLAFSYHVAFGFNAVLWTITVVAFAYIAVETAGTRRKRGPVALKDAEEETPARR